MTRIAALALIAALLPGCALLTKPSSLAQSADVATTAIGLAQPGVTEANTLLAGAVEHPMGLAAVWAAKQALVWGAHRLSPADCRMASGALFGVGAAATINNVAVIAGAGSIGLVMIPVAAGLWALHAHNNWDRCGDTS